MKKTPLKKGLKTLHKGGSLTKVAIKKKMREEKKKADMFNFFEGIWNQISFEDRRCNSCGASLYSPFKSYYFDHLIEKSKRPDLALERGNMFICCFDCHYKKTNGHPTKKHQEAVEKAKERFGIS